MNVCDTCTMYDVIEYIYMVYLYVFVCVLSMVLFKGAFLSDNLLTRFGYDCYMYD